ncbi:MAG: DUF362 domain-containing protein, partial [Deltaproteobacteria bacterium]|nr:DUF362 domain-containing protein [Deltaproteobacteria bacterium]
PNPPSWATTTHPDVIRELGRLCHEAGASSILVLDNPLRNAALCLKRTGIKDALKDIPGARVEALKNEGFYREVKVTEGLELKTTMIMKPVLDADVLIAAPVAKSHSATGLSFAMKGMMGLIYRVSPGLGSQYRCRGPVHPTPTQVDHHRCIPHPLQRGSRRPRESPAHEQNHRFRGHGGR